MSTKTKSENLIEKIKQFWLKYEPKIILGIGFILVAMLAFEAGALKGQNWQKDPLVIEKPVVAGESQEKTQNSSQTLNLGLKETSTPSQASNTTPSNTAQNCAFVGSKNSNKYYPPSCSYAKRIKPENLVCFKDAAEAQGRGYQAVNCK
jgi:hypothetical protein